MPRIKRIRRAIILAVLLSSGIVALLPCRTISISARIADPPQKVISPIDEIRNVAKLKRIPAEDLLAISAQESSLGKFKSGDGGCSRGWFHINLCANPSAAAAIGDVTKEATWVADRLISCGYRDDRVTAIGCYNSPARPNYSYAKLVEKRLLELAMFLEPYETAKAQTPR